MWPMSERIMSKACGRVALIFQDLLQLHDLPSVEIGEIGMKLDCPDRLTLHLGDKLTSAKLQFA